MYGHAPTLLTLNVPAVKEKDWEYVLQPLRERYGDVEEVVTAKHPREMLQALFGASLDYLKGIKRPAEWERRVENYDQCVADYDALLDCIQAQLN